MRVPLITATPRAQGQSILSDADGKESANSRWIVLQSIGELMLPKSGVPCPKVISILELPLTIVIADESLPWM
jgi:hypothetical protein